MSTSRTDLVGTSKHLGLFADILWHAGLGGLEGLKAYHVHGYSSDMPTSYGVLWEEGTDLIPARNTGLSNAEFFVASDDANDTDGGSGAETVHVWGYDTLGFYKEAMVTLGGTTPVSIGTGWLFVQHLMVMSTGSGEENAGNIYCGTGTFTAGKPASGALYNMIAATEGMSHTSMAFIPSGYDGFVMFSAACTARNATNNVTFRLRQQSIANGVLGPRQTLDKFVVVQDMSNRTHPAGFRVAQQSWIWQDGKASTGNMDACTMMDILLIRRNPDNTSVFTEEEWLTLEAYTMQAG